MQVEDRARREEDEPGFRVTDRRRAGTEGSREPAEPAQAQEARAPGEPPGDDAEGSAADIHALPVADLLRVFIAELHARAWTHMGLMVNPATNLLSKDLPQAKLAIDCIASLIEHLGPSAAEAERFELERLLADLRVNFVRQTGV
jgi:uncharacterized protein DUF1844